MIPVWFFVLLIILICYLLYITRTNEESLYLTGRNQLRRLHYWFRNRNR